MARKSLSERLWSRVKIAGADECWEWQGYIHNKGYGQIGRGAREEGLIYTHRAAWEIANGESVPDGMFIRHSCDNPRCCNPAHLSPGTPKQNTGDMISRRRHSHGERHGARLTDSDVVRIKALARGNRTQQSIADEFGVSRSLVGLIAQGKRWRHL
jgi:hypothetical protein